MMLTKMKIALVMAGSLVFGVAAAQGTSAPQVDRKAEHKAKRAEMLQKFDGNKDGKLDETERKAAHEQMVLERFKKLDTDGNGVLSLTEFKAGKHGKLGKRHARGGKDGLRGGMHRGMNRGAGDGRTE